MATQAEYEYAADALLEFDVIDSSPMLYRGGEYEDGLPFFFTAIEPLVPDLRDVLKDINAKNGEALHRRYRGGLAVFLKAIGDRDPVLDSRIGRGVEAFLVLQP